MRMWDGTEHGMLWSDVFNAPHDRKAPFYFGPLAGYEKEHLPPGAGAAAGVGRGENPEDQNQTPEDVKQAWKRGLGQCFSLFFSLFMCWCTLFLLNHVYTHCLSKMVYAGLLFTRNMRHRLHDTAPLLWIALAPLPWKWVVLFPMGAFTRDGASAVAVDGVGAIDGVPCSLQILYICTHFPPWQKCRPWHRRRCRVV